VFFFNTLVGGFIIIGKTTFDFSFDLYQAFKQHEYRKNGNREKLLIKESNSKKAC